MEPAVLDDGHEMAAGGPGRPGPTPPATAFRGTRAAADLAGPRGAGRRLADTARRWVRRPSRNHDTPLPAPVGPPVDGRFETFYRERLVAHTHDHYMGIPLQKMPEDLRVYEHLLWSSRANVVVELGANLGGSTLWFRDRLAALHRYRRTGLPHVIAVDLVAEATAASIRRIDPDARGITFIAADVTDPALPGVVAGLLRPDDRVLVVEDTAHIYETTMAALDGFSRFVSPGSYLVVEDTVVDVEALRIDPAWPRGVAPAVSDWLAGPSGAGFEIALDAEIYGVTSHPRGFLRRTE